MEYTSKISVEPINVSAADLDVVHAARVCTGKQVSDQVPTKESEGLINYLVKHRHGTPFEHGMFKFYVHAPILVWREWHRHRIGFSYNEESGRYKKLEPVFYIPDLRRPMMKVDSWKPGRPKFTQADVDTHSQLVANLKLSYAIAYKKYEENLALNIDPGLARDCLPVGIYSSCYVTCNPRSLMAFLSLRTHDLEARDVSYPLWEIQLAALQVEKIFKASMPITYRAFIDNGRCGP